MSQVEDKHPLIASGPERPPQLILDLKTTLKAVGAENVLCHETPYYRIDPKWVRCDYLSYLDTGKPSFHGEYMTQYSWAESTCAMLQFKNHF